MFTRQIKAVAKRHVQLANRIRASKDVHKLMRHRDFKVKKVGTALINTLGGRFSAEEKRAMNAIEVQRQLLLDSKKLISVVDYGAGSKEDSRSQDEMNQGKKMELPVAQVAQASKSEFWAQLMFALVREFKPERILELGSCVGISGAYQAAATEINGGGMFVTIEGSPEIADLAKSTLNHYNNTEILVGRFQEQIPVALKSAESLDFFFNDGHHDHKAVIRYFDQVRPYLAKTAIVVVDDITWSEGMRAAWNEIMEFPEVLYAINLHKMGILLLGEGDKATFTIPMW